MIHKEDSFSILDNHPAISKQSKLLFFFVFKNSKTKPQKIFKKKKTWNNCWIVSRPMHVFEFWWEFLTNNQCFICILIHNVHISVFFTDFQINFKKISKFQKTSKILRFLSKKKKNKKKKTLIWTKEPKQLLHLCRIVSWMFQYQFWWCQLADHQPNMSRFLLCRDWIELHLQFCPINQNWCLTMRFSGIHFLFECWLDPKAVKNDKNKRNLKENVKFWLKETKKRKFWVILMKKNKKREVFELFLEFWVQKKQ